MKKYWIWVYHRPGHINHGKYAEIHLNFIGVVTSVKLTENLYGATVCSKPGNNVTKTVLPSKYYRKQLVDLTLELL